MSPTAALSEIRTKIQAEPAAEKTQVLVGLATCAIAAGAKETYNVLQEVLRVAGLLETAVLRQVGCVGRCSLEPLVEIRRPGEAPRLYVQVDAERARQIVARDLVGGAPVTEWTLGAQPVGTDILLDTPGETAVVAGEGLINRFVDDYALIPFFGNQVRIALRNIGRIDPDSLGDYLEMHGYEALAKVFEEMTPEQVIAEVTASGLRGRGGAGFPTGMKWKFTAEAPATPKYVICNADEGDPGAFMDRSTLEGDPHAVLEAMIIAGYAVGSHQGYIYIRAEYPLAVQRLRKAIADAYAAGLLGPDILGSGFAFDLELRLGAGAFVCGEETALIASIEGKRGMPRPRPPYPATAGLWGQPTLINNVETYANIAPIILLGAAWFASIGTEQSKGTKVFALAGNVNNTGLIEVPMGTTLREIIYSIGGGIPGGKAFKAAQTGGPSGGMLPESYLDTPVDYGSLQAAGTIMGSGGLIVMDHSTCMVDMAKFFLTFTQDESCGKCTPCREGTLRMLEILERITTGRGEPEDLDKLARLAQLCRRASLCGLGQGAPNPILSVLRHFPEECQAHIADRRCPAGQCKALVTYHILEATCVGCGLCRRTCPVHCISGDPRQPHVIDESRCVRCGKCLEVCKFGAVERV
jgi:NADH-quinone oxidoreductase subunit F/NADP-reducing hydrogenase subunit HndC